ncbi:hypothetical protein F0562_034465 [Nyssa sinensis]|uniref:BHLH domain-containing protein n=1 Tax=Nyssa sinensis TaxID=561372 RepID=A0A5J5ALH3_9ASTE|nr:hypothetical protein F0562_034465 [Nyssa sinensis]
MFEPAFDCLKKTENSWEFTNSTSFNNFEKHYDGFNESLIETEKLNKQSNLVSNWSIALPNLEVNPQLETRACNISFSSRTDQHSQSNLCDVKEKVSDSTAFVGGINRNSETVLKKPKNENPTVSSAKMRVPKVKMGDKITALQQIVSPFGRTDTASVLLEAIGYIKFLQGQIQILSNPYMETNVSKDPWGGLDEKDRGDTKLDLKGRGLCLTQEEMKGKVEKLEAEFVDTGYQLFKKKLTKAYLDLDALILDGIDIPLEELDVEDTLTEDNEPFEDLLTHQPVAQPNLKEKPLLAEE